MMNKYKKILIPVIGCLFIFTTFCLTWSGLRYLLVDDTTSYTRVMMHEFYDQDDISVMVMGASHCYRGFDTDVLDEELGVNTFNAGSSNQTLDITYSLMKEAIQLYDLDHIYVDLSYNIAQRSMDKSSNPTATYLITDYMKPSINKYKLLIDKSLPEAYANSFLLARRNYEKLFDLEYIKTLLNTKSTEAYKTYQPIVRETEWYVKKGFVAENTKKPDGRFFDGLKNETCDLDQIDPNWAKTVLDMIQYCDEHHVKLTFISVPVTSYRLVAYGNYDAYYQYIMDLLEPYDVDYYDFNMMKASYFEDTAAYYNDFSHLNCYGAEKFTKLFCEFIKGNISEEDLFYDSVNEKYAQLPATFYGMVYQENEEAGNAHQCKLVTNHEGKLKFKIYIDDENEKPVLLRDYDTSTDFVVPANYKGDIYVHVAGGNYDDTEYAIQTNFKEDK